MTHILTEYSLTQYTDFRKLQFAYTKIKDQNDQLRLRLIESEKLYENTIRQLTQYRRNTSKLETERLDHMKQEMHEKSVLQNELEQIQAVLNQLRNQDGQYHQPLNSKKKENRLLVIESAKTIYKEIRYFSDEYSKLKRTVNQLLDQTVQKQRIWAEREQKFSQQIAELQLDLKSLEKMIAQLQQENEKFIRENQQLQSQIKSYKTIAIQARNQRSSPKKQTQCDIKNDFNEDDKSFATDLLCYEKQMLLRVFLLVIESFQGNDKDIQFCLRKIYEAYNQVTECFRQKLQIQYDLQDLQYQYQKQKAATPNKQLLVQLKKQINNFRKELFNQKQLLHNKEDELEDKIRDLSGEAVHDHRLKSFTINLQEKLRKKTRIDTNQNEKNIQMPRYRENEEDANEDNKLRTMSLEFKHTLDTDEMVKKIIQQDRQNLEKMLKQTRNKLRK